MTKDDVRAEHLRAMARLDAEQVAALKRINCAFRNSRFDNRTVKEALDDLFAEEAQHRSGEGPRPSHMDVDPTDHGPA
jgi:hypothetical protein